MTLIRTGFGIYLKILIVEKEGKFQSYREIESTHEFEFDEDYKVKNNIDFTTVTACGECCVGCKKKEDGICQGCIESDGHCVEWEQSNGCPIHKCTREHNVQFCGLCKEFPCEWLIQKVVWRQNVVEELTELANLYRQQN